ncbi:MAG: right-handed parallel beta-helix repeat-containing protein, partial [Opitutales bacterium]|nr:right-handed parallel beta-helix repeat-containing protein [Opitutales bacterium]
MRLTKTRVSGLWMGAVVVAGSVFAGTYYVSPDSVSTDWAAAANAAIPCTVQTAFDNAQAGDTVQFRGGIYLVPQRPTGNGLTGYYNLAHSGTTDNPILIMAYPGEIPVFDGTSGGSIDIDGHGYNGFATILGFYRVDNVVIDGLTFQGDGGVAEARVNVASGDNNYSGKRYGNIVIRNCVFNGGTSDNAARVQIDGVWTGTADNHEGLFLSQVSNVTVSNCRFYNYRHATNNGNTSAIKTYHCDRLCVENCELFGNTFGIHYKTNTDDSVISRNYIHHNYIGAYLWNYLSQSSINVSVYHNIFAFNSQLAFTDVTQESSASDGLAFYNNTCYSGDEKCVSVELAGGINKQFYNNIFKGLPRDNDIGLFRFRPNGTIPYSVDICDYNQFGNVSSSSVLRSIQLIEPGVWESQTCTSLAQWQALTIVNGGGHPDIHSFASDPLFVNASGTMSLVSDFALQVGSPCKGAGRGGVDMGADVSLVGVQGNRPPVLAPIGNRSVPAGQTLQITVQA